MFIKLQFTADKPLYQVVRVIADVINTSSVTSIATLRTRATAASYDASLLNLLDDANSTIIRTNDPTNVVTHIAGNTSTKVWYLTFQFSIFDNTSTKFYIQWINTQTATNPGNSSYWRTGTALSGGTINSSAMAPSAPDNTNSTVGTVLTNAGTTGGGASANNFVTDTTYAGIRTLWMYINNNGMVWAINQNSSNTAGWPTGYSALTWSGPWIFSQYTRDDYTNGEFTNNFTYPFMYPNTRGAGVGFGTAYDNITSSWSSNPLYTTAAVSAQPFRVTRLVNNIPSTLSASPTEYTNVIVGYTLDGYTSAHRALGFASTATTANLLTYLRITDNTLGYKIPSANLQTPVFGQHDIGWEHSYYSCFGGSASQLLGVYVFNGDYSPGDEYTISGITYMIWPVYIGYADRLGLGIPKA